MSDEKRLKCSVCLEPIDECEAKDTCPAANVRRMLKRRTPEAKPCRMCGTLRSCAGCQREAERQRFGEAQPLDHAYDCQAVLGENDASDCDCDGSDLRSAEASKIVTGAEFDRDPQAVYEASKVAPVTVLDSQGRPSMTVVQPGPVEATTPDTGPAEAGSRAGQHTSPVSRAAGPDRQRDTGDGGERPAPIPRPASASPPAVDLHKAREALADLHTTAMSSEYAVQYDLNRRFLAVDDALDELERLRALHGVPR